MPRSCGDGCRSAQDRARTGESSRFRQQCPANQPPRRAVIRHGVRMQATFRRVADTKASRHRPAGADLKARTRDQQVTWARAMNKATGGPKLAFPAGPKGPRHRFVPGFMLPAGAGRDRRRESRPCRAGLGCDGQAVLGCARPVPLPRTGQRRTGRRRVDRRAAGLSLRGPVWLVVNGMIPDRLARAALPRSPRTGRRRVCRSAIARPGSFAPAVPAAAESANRMCQSDNSRLPERIGACPAARTRRDFRVFPEMTQLKYPFQYLGGFDPDPLFVVSTIRRPDIGQTGYNRCDCSVFPVLDEAAGNSWNFLDSIAAEAWHGSR